MTAEERVDDLENKLVEVVELLKFIIQVDDGIKAKDANLVLAQLDEIQKWEY